ncbi:gamma-aminobutyric acid transporter [Lactifluus volemus]|nr:gamma-aminobutyric acid transporter [Lactifluus volemus]
MWGWIKDCRVLRANLVLNSLSMSAPINKEHKKGHSIQSQQIGYKQHLHRAWNLLENFAASFVALDFIGSVRSALFLGLQAGGPAAVWSTSVITMVFMVITAFVLAEISSALPLTGSIHIWAAESAGPKYGRFVGFLVAWWTASAWMTYAAGNCQATANYIVSQLAIWQVNFPGGIDNGNVKWRAFVWAVSEATLILSGLINYLPPKWNKGVFRFSLFILMLDFFLCLIWLPIAVHNTYGIRSAKDVFTQGYNGTGAPAGWNWLLSFLFTAGVVTGFDASGYVAEETKHANVVASKGIISSAIATGVLGFITTILFLFCIPDLDEFFELSAPQPFVQLYALALGNGPSIFMTIIAVISLVMSTTAIIDDSSRLIFAIARDGVFPYSSWISRVDAQGQPKNAVTIILIFSATLLLSILPSQVAFTSLTSAGSMPIIAAYGLIALLRLTLTPHAFKTSRFHLGRWARPMYLSTVLFNGLVFAAMMSPFYFPVTVDTFNFACVIFGAATIVAIYTWYFKPADQWLCQVLIKQAMHTAEGSPIDDAMRTSSIALDRMEAD